MKCTLVIAVFALTACLGCACTKKGGPPPRYVNTQGERSLTLGDAEIAERQYYFEELRQIDISYLQDGEATIRYFEGAGDVEKKIIESVLRFDFRGLLENKLIAEGGLLFINYAGTALLLIEEFARIVEADGASFRINNAAYGNPEFDIESIKNSLGYQDEKDCDIVVYDNVIFPTILLYVTNDDFAKDRIKKREMYRWWTELYPNLVPVVLFNRRRVGKQDWAYTVLGITKSDLKPKLKVIYIMDR